MAVRYFTSSFLFMFILCFISIRLSIALENQETFIVLMSKSKKPHLFSTHHDWYSSIIRDLSHLSHHPSKLLYTYDRVVHGFAARLTPSQASELQKIPGVISVIPDQIRQLHTTRSPQFLGLSESSGLWPSSNYGDGVIVGVLDTGIWPESPSFSDEGLSPVPSSWKGKCENSTDFPETLCNRKIIGARAFYTGYEADFGRINETVESKSPRDTLGHGTHTASIAAGATVANASVFGYAQGEARGIAVKARISVYKFCWLKGCSNTDFVAAMDRAVKDGVHVVSVSSGTNDPMDYYMDITALVAFAAMQQGVVFSTTAGNTGPDPFTTKNVAPWILTVGASTIDRKFPADVLLADEWNFTGETLYYGEPLAQNQFPLVYGGDANSTDCLSGELDASKVNGKIVLCDVGSISPVEKGVVVRDAGGVGMIVALRWGEQINAYAYYVPASVAVDETDGDEIYDYINSNPSPTASIVFRETTVVGKNTPSAPRVAGFSGRGPNRITPEILKPDVIAPGINILAAWTNATSPSELDIDQRRVEFNILSGTSMACPHVSGLAALIRNVYPEWSPAAIKSALMTTAYTVDNSGNNLIDQSSSALSNSYIHGSGHVDPSRALDPGLVYDLGLDDYVNFLCTIGYNTQQISMFVMDSTLDCSTRQLGTPGNLNYPAFSVVYYNGANLVQYKRSVKNVGSEKNVTYKVKVNAPLGVQVSISPTKLVFNEMNDTLSYQVNFTSTGPTTTNDSFGLISWEDGVHTVTSPIAVLWRTSSLSTL